MNKLKNRKRLTTVVIAFLLTFVVGAAFALNPGILEIRGTVNITAPGALYVVWDSVDDGNPSGLISPLWGSFGTISSTASIVNANGRTNQRIVWSIEFDEFDSGTGAQAGITAIARNNATIDALVSTRTPVFTWSNPTLAADLGLTVDIDDMFFNGTILAGGTSMPLVATIIWDGSIPASATPGQSFTLDLIIDIDYIAA